MGHGGGRKHDATATDVIWILIACVFSCHSRVEPPQYYQYNATTHDPYEESLSYIILHPHFIPPNLDVWVQQTATHFQPKTNRKTHTRGLMRVSQGKVEGLFFSSPGERKSSLMACGWRFWTLEQVKQIDSSSLAPTHSKHRNGAGQPQWSSLLWRFIDFVSSWWPIISSP